MPLSELSEINTASDIPQRSMGVPDLAWVVFWRCHSILDNETPEGSSAPAALLAVQRNRDHLAH